MKAAGKVWSEAYNITDINDSTNPLLLVGNGGYKIKSAVTGQSVTLVLNPKHVTNPSGPKTNGVKTIIFRVVGDGTAAAQALRNQEIDLYDGQPTAEIGFLGMVRDEKTLKATTYANRLPEELTGRQCYILDPMLATGGTLVSAIEFLAAKGAKDITAICILAAPEGVAVLEKGFASSSLQLKLVTGALDERLNEKGYIVPGLGDAGDRLYGVV